MADLQMLYDEEGLQGILPYAFGMSGPGYRFLCERMKEGIQVFVIGNSRHLPFMDTQDEKVFVYLYSDPALAEGKLDELASRNYEISIEPMDTTPVPEVWKRYRDLGVTHLRIDDALWVAIKDLAPVATYDGYLNQNAPLRNAELNTALYCLYQELDADNPCDALLSYFWEVFMKSCFYLPVRPTRKLAPGEALTPENSDFHYIPLDDGTTAYAVFTDQDFLLSYGVSMGMKAEEFTAAFTPMYEDLMEFLNVDDDWSIVLNPLYGSFVLTKEWCENASMVALNNAARAYSRR